MISFGKVSAAAVLWLLCMSCTVLGKSIDNTTYWQQREILLAKDYSTMFGSSLTLSPEEELVNNLIMDVKAAEMDKALLSLNFPPAKNFMLAKQDIDKSEVFAFIKKMPKGAVLHVHDTSMTTVEWVVSELTYWEDLYMCYMDGLLMFRFMAAVGPECAWLLVSDERAKATTPQEFDKFLYDQISMVTPDPAGMYPDINAVWTQFLNYFATLSGIVDHRPAFEAYLSRGFAEFSADGVCYVEFRGVLPLLYELDGSKLTALETLAVYNETIAFFVQNNREVFHGARFIYAPIRSVDESVVWNYVASVVTFKEAFPDLIAGFDLVSQEDLGRPLKEFIDPLLSLQESNITIPVFYHAGETNWYGEDVDENLADALLLNTTRIGHGYAITKHPGLKQETRNRDIPLEVCPISNQVLLLVDDLRNHPAVGLFAEDFPLVVSSDDPASWGALPLSHDFYEAFMAFGGAKADLTFLKKLALNSIKYSSLDAPQKFELQRLWQSQWDSFINNTIQALVYNDVFTGNSKVI